MKVSVHLSENIDILHQRLPIDKSFDLITRKLLLGSSEAYWIGVNGLCEMDIIQQLFSDLQSGTDTNDAPIDNLEEFAASKTGYAQLQSSKDWDTLIENLLSGPSLLFVDGFDYSLIIDARTYPTRGIKEPDAEPVSQGARDGFVETLLFNANLIRRRIRSEDLTFAMHHIGAESHTDVAVVYRSQNVNKELLNHLSDCLDQLKVSSLTMGATSLKELLVPHKWWNPLPSVFSTERPDVACSYLLEGHILVLVDNSPMVLVFPGTIFQFTQSCDDYYRTPLVGSYFRLVRFLCIPVNLLLMPLFLLIGAYYPQFALKWHIISSDSGGPIYLMFFVFAVEFLLDLFKYSSSLSSDRFSGALSIVSGLLIGDIAIKLQWASPETLFYGAVSLLANLSIASKEFSEALRVYRVFLLITTALGGPIGFGIGIILILLSALTTPVFGGYSYFWPLFPFHWKALCSLLFRRPTSVAQPCRTWSRGNVQK